MTRFSASSPGNFANAIFKEAQKGLAARTLFAIKTATTPIQMVAAKANKYIKLQNLPGVKPKPRNRKK
jgi:hypothetical protein